MVRYYTPQISKMKNGNYQYSIRYRDPSFLGIKKKSIVIKKNTSYARTNAELIVKRKIREAIGKVGYQTITFQNLSKKYFESITKKGLAYKTILTYKSQLNQLNRYFKNQVVSTITTVEINKFLDDIIYKQNLTNTTAHAYYSILNLLMNYAKQFGYIKDSPMADVKVNYKNESQKKQYRMQNWYLTDEEFQKLLTDCDRHQRHDFHDFIEWLYLTGMRIGEGGAIQVKDIFVKDNTYFAKVNGTLIRKIGEGWVKQPFTKTKSSNRDVALPDEAVSIYKKHAATKHPDDFLITNQRTGNPINTNCLDPVLHTMCKRQNIKKPITSHIFRHTHVSKLSELGYPLDIISARVGHENEEITRKIYLHVTNSKAKKYNEMIKSFKIPEKLS